MALDFEALAATPVGTEPFRHVVVADFVPRALLERVIADLPRIGRRGSFPLGALHFGPAAREVLEELQGERFRAAVAEKFGLDLTGAPIMITLRGRTAERDGRIHTDSVSKRVTVLLYLNRDDAAWQQHQGCLRLLRGPGDLEDYAVEVPPVNGTLLVFPNGPKAWHGHHRFVGPRNTVQLNYMASDAAARSELRRHRVSALLKRLTAWT